MFNVFARRKNIKRKSQLDTREIQNNKVQHKKNHKTKIYIKTRNECDLCLCRKRSRELVTCKIIARVSYRY